MERYRMFKVTTIKETNTRPIKIKIVDTWQLGSAIIGYSAEGAAYRDQRAVEFLQEKGIEIVAESCSFDGSETCLLTKDFKTSI